MIVYVSVGAFSVAWTIWLVLLRSEDATVVVSSSFFVPLGTLFLGWVLLAEGITFQSAFGTAFGVCEVNMSGV
jgi:drug/metabolite transporter (DMT)-like permease